MTAIELSNYGGLLALALLTINILLGMLISTKYNPVRQWPRRRINTVRIHTWSGYAALATSALHPVLLLFSATAGFALIDVVWPLGAPKQPIVNTLGALALVLLATVVATSFLWQQRIRISRQVWKRFHFLTYALFPLYAVHALLTDPALKDQPFDPLDAEKVFVEVCVLAVVIAIIFRVRWQRRQPPARAARHHAGSAPLVLWISAGLTLATVASSSVEAQESSLQRDGWSYSGDVGPTYRRSDFTYAVWGFAERYWGPKSAVVNADFWRRFRQGMEFDFPRIGAAARTVGTARRTTGGVRPVLFYEIDLTDNNFFRNGARSQVFENVYVALQHADDPTRGRILFGENTHIISREDNLSSGNLPTINRSLVLEEHGSVNSFGTQWGVEASRALTPRVTIAVAAQDNRGSLNTVRPRYKVGNSLAAKLTAVAYDDTTRSRRLTLGVGIDHTRDLGARAFTIASAIGAQPMGALPAGGNKATLEGDAALAASFAGHATLIEAEALLSQFSATHTAVVGGYLQLQVSLFDTPSAGDLDPFIRYDVVRVARAMQSPSVGSGPPTIAAGLLDGALMQHAMRAGFNYGLPRMGKFVSLHLEYALTVMAASTQAVATAPKSLSEFRFGVRANAARYVRH